MSSTENSKNLTHLKQNALIAVVGRPNAGKSTMVNRIVGEKVAIVSDKPQTTRHRVMGVLTRGDTQLVFADTPGYHRPRTRLGHYMVGVSKDSASGCDCAALVIEPIPAVGDLEGELIERLKTLKVPAVLVINKIDTLKDRETVLAVIAAYSERHEFAAIVPVCARKGDGFDVLLAEFSKFAKEEAGFLFPEDEKSDQPDKVLIAEIIREKALRLLDKEVPHGLAVVVERLNQKDSGLVECDAVIFCERDSHKGIIIGRSGAMLGRIGERSRVELEEFYGEKVMLKLFVKVKENWRDDIRRLGEFGYQS